MSEEKRNAIPIPLDLRTQDLKKKRKKRGNFLIVSYFQRSLYNAMEYARSLESKASGLESQLPALLDL